MMRTKTWGAEKRMRRKCLAVTVMATAAEPEVVV